VNGHFPFGVEMRCLKSSFFGKMEIYKFMKLAEKVARILIPAHISP